MTTFNEADHPRGQGGKWTEKARDEVDPGLGYEPAEALDDPYATSSLEAWELVEALADLDARLYVSEGTEYVEVSTGFNEAVLVEVDPTADEPFDVVLSRWDNSGGVMAEANVGRARSVGEALDLVHDAYDGTLPRPLQEHRNDDGALHRLDGPAVLGEDLEEQWWVNGDKVLDDSNRHMHVIDWGDAEWAAEGFEQMGRSGPFDVVSPASNASVQAWLTEMEPKVGDPRTAAVMRAFQDGVDKARSLIDPR